MTAEEYPGRGQLPDKLAFVTPNRARAYVALHDADGPLTAEELTDTLECSSATAYRCMSDLEALGLVTDAVKLEPNAPPKSAYQTTALEEQDSPVRARTDGGERE